MQNKESKQKKLDRNYKLSKNAFYGNEIEWIRKLRTLAIMKQRNYKKS